MQAPQIKVDGVMVIALLVVVAAGVIWWNRKAIVETVTTAVDPTNPENLANRAFNAVTDPIIPGNESFGAWCADNQSNPACWGFVVLDKIIPE